MTVPGPVSSPCVGICRIDPGHGLCLGCWRDLGEIAGWGAMAEAERRAVMAALPLREARLAARPVAPEAGDAS